MADEDRHLRRRAGRREVGDLLQRGCRRHDDPRGGEQPRRPRPGADDNLARGQHAPSVGAEGDLPAVILDAGDPDSGPDLRRGRGERTQRLVGGDHAGLGFQQGGPADGDPREPGRHLAGRQQLARRARAAHAVLDRVQPVAEGQVRGGPQDPLARLILKVAPQFPGRAGPSPRSRGRRSRARKMRQLPCEPPPGWPTAACSRTRTSRPRPASARPAASPSRPAPTTMNS